eukprot:CAMPEP_0176369524 /NCGR_PEP_ID=MMETSP0126-20121128/23345_1 /TAXON_ID=141414 ORGANISM="Strombidinopsis acuminatum, Strain SPMC142" /NCGR_SAMPLE_ID=MMETSP0126 /ASSEMBLY_ACC=CAM_ASM_000229 /LENGTH=124 /DNA_ID=CAMNT_0017728189 /DNA_START=115 /DNA_END=489 /DNA_ORIENTATION=+
MKLKNGDLYQATMDIEAISEYLDMYSYVLYGFSAVAFVTALLGCVSATCKNRCPVFFFGFLSFIVTLVYLIIGLVLVGIVLVSGDQIDKFCVGEYEQSNAVGTAYQYVVDVDQFYFEIGKNMCR